MHGHTSRSIGSSSASTQDQVKIQKSQSQKLEEYMQVQCTTSSALGQASEHSSIHIYICIHIYISKV